MIEKNSEKQNIKKSKVICFLFTCIFKQLNKRFFYFLFLFEDDLTKGKGSISHRKNGFYLLNTKAHIHKFLFKIEW